MINTLKQELHMNEKPKLKYQKVSTDIRKEVLNRLLVKKDSIQKVATDLNLKYCTCRTIKQSFQADGQIGKKHTRRKKLKIETKMNIQILNPVSKVLSTSVELSTQDYFWLEPKQIDNKEFSSVFSKKQFLSQINLIKKILEKEKQKKQENQLVIQNLIASVTYLQKKIDHKSITDSNMHNTQIENEHFEVFQNFIPSVMISLQQEAYMNQITSQIHKTLAAMNYINLYQQRQLLYKLKIRKYNGKRLQCSLYQSFVKPNEFIIHYQINQHVRFWNRFHQILQFSPFKEKCNLKKVFSFMISQINYILHSKQSMEVKTFQLYIQIAL